MKFEKLPKRVASLCEPYTVYRLEDVRASGAELHPLGDHGNEWLAVWTDDGIVIEYAFFQFVMSDADRANAEYQCLWMGSGTGDSLREMRHTYFMPDAESDTRGYVFYLPIDATIQALTILKRYFD